VSECRSKWKTNPHFNGSYTYQSLEAERRNVSREDLGRPVCDSDGKPVLLFAGEATHSKFYATVHGAIETGFNEADRILEIYKNKTVL
jgi:spermine oxidase